MTAAPCTPTPSYAIGAAAATAVATALKAISDPLRLRMLSAIATAPRGEACVCDLAELSDVSQPTVSHHLRVMRDTGLLTSERRGTWVYYRITPDRKDAVTALLEGFAPAAVVDDAPADDVQSAPAAALDSQVEHLANAMADEMDHLSRDLVVAIVRESFTALVRQANVTLLTIPLTERFARQRLAHLSRDRADGVPQVLFVCVANAGRSQLAAALLNQLADGAAIAYSAGSAPAADVHPHVRSLLAEIEGDSSASRAFPKPLTDDAVRASDVVITMGCGDVCPIIPGVRYDDWAVGDPALASNEGVAAIRAAIEGRVKRLLATLTTH